MYWQKRRGRLSVHGGEHQCLTLAGVENDRRGAAGLGRVERSALHIILDIYNNGTFTSIILHSLVNVNFCFYIFTFLKKYP